jgi:hypothetical protein
MGAISAAYRRVQSRVCAALSIHDGCVMSWAACIHRAKWRGMKRETTRRDTHLRQLFDPETISSISTFATLHRVFWFPAQPSSTLDRVLTYFHADTAVHIVRISPRVTYTIHYASIYKQTRWSPYCPLFSRFR